jgi:phospholipase C
MDYYDGNSVTALWNYAQQYSMSDNAYGTTYGPFEYYASSTANPMHSPPVVITWDDSDGWYDSILGPIETQSQTSADALTGAGQCGNSGL